MPYPKAGMTERAWRGVDKRGPDECWPWMQHKNRDGYGLMRLMPKGQALSHRVIFAGEHGYLPPVVRHSCDNPGCCNPRHLVGGTQADNMKDMVERGRQGRRPHTKLTEEDVRYIRNSAESLKSLGLKFGVDHSTVWKARTGRSFRWVKGDN